jgi:predicted anti-sigma-YlaC factor YlaD
MLDCLLTFSSCCSETFGHEVLFAAAAGALLQQVCAGATINRRCQQHLPHPLPALTSITTGVTVIFDIW